MTDIRTECLEACLAADDGEFDRADEKLKSALSKVRRAKTERPKP